MSTTERSTIGSDDNSSVRLLLCLKLLVLCVTACAGAPSEMASLELVLDRVRAQPPRQVEVAEQIIGKQLQLNNRSFFESYEARNFSLERLRIEVAQFRPQANAEKDALLLLQIRDVCVPRSSVEEQYPDLVIVQAPEAHSPDSEVVYSRPESWGRLNFGFAQSNMDCLRSVAAFVDDPDQ